ncbi:RHS repeat protein [Pseudomonas sp. ITEM 17296]|uniref:RHS repeat domain-containing protein n=1 Tax=Pseudomonas sp. ITEM 17296 TaxID=2790281 RepID=UPI000C127DC0|nr:RHS repeat protein [Pseudomonas sp. ITEM 17296]ATP49151.1 hypothetical protein CR512_07155 [Pseudomonas putida]MDE4539633.1 RHS repeat protein [Pseudomonas sp. ITEM 17296]GLO57270.1 sugar-binding protein [Pseudomonas putida]
MSASTSVHSNAFNFSSYIESGVDSRTGQYTVSIKLPELKGNDLQGPDFNLGLFYSPLNVEDSGFGRGWNLQLTQVRNNIVTLRSGETYKITGESTVTGRLEMSEQKLRQFDLYHEPPGQNGAKRYRVEHRSGLVEVLETMGPQQAQVSLPIELHSPLGPVLYLKYEPTLANHMRLRTVTDGTEEILSLERQGNSRVDILCYPYGGDDGDPLARYVMTLSQSDNRVSEIILPTPNQARWRFTYRDVRGFLCLNEVTTPYGGHESIFYEDLGHEFPPSAGRANLPRVTRHETSPRFEQPTMVVKYEYPGVNNFVGGGSTIPWDDEGLDNLYKVAKDYSYQTREIQGSNNDRTITRRFNRFHLLVAQQTSQGENKLDVTTAYGEIDGSFDQQPPAFQLPVEVTSRWTGPFQEPNKPPVVRQRLEKQVTSYDNQGNVLTRLEPNQVLETNVWYSAEEEGKPHGFVRHLKSRTVRPAPNGQGAAPTLTQLYAYKPLAPRGSYLTQPWWLVESESIFEAGGKPDDFIEKISFEYYDALTAPTYQYGRVSTRTVSYHGSEAYDTITRYAYSTSVAKAVLQTTETLEGFDGQTKVITLEHDLQTGETVLNRDDNNVEIRYEFDALRRVTRETVAPGTDFEAYRRYKYHLCAYDNEQAQQWAYDVKGVETSTYFDGLSRAILETREDHDSKTFAGGSRPIYRAKYDQLGQLSEETEIDWLGDQLLELTSTYAYDDWGQQRSVTGPDGVTEVEEVSQVQSPDGPVQHNWRERDGIRLSGITQTWHNLFEKPAKIERFALDGTTSISLQVNSYDGLGRLSKEAKGSGTGQRIDEYVYDAFDRLLVHTLADRNNRVYRTYAKHSRNDLPVSIKVGTTEANAKLLGEQAFDGLERRISATTGGRLQTFEYDPGERQPRWVTAPDGRKIEYTYVPVLGEEPTTRVLSGKPASYVYDPKNAKLTHCEEPGDARDPGHSMDRTYFLSNGEVKTETRILEGETFSMTYDYSYRRRMRAYLDVQGQNQVYEYDDFGRLESTTLSKPVPTPSRYRVRRKPLADQILLSASFTYDDLGRMESTTTQDVTTGQQLTTRLEYDEFDRETLRTFDFGDILQTLEQGYDEFDCLTHRILKERLKDADEEDAKLLRHEKYAYDRRGRLQRYDCTGPEAPVDPSGNIIEWQTFGFDGLDNITSVITKSPGGTPQRTLYEFRNVDPAQLSKIVPPAPQPAIDLHYDANGNLISDEQKRVLVYDELNRLISVETQQGEACRYHYDPENILSGTTQA